jgi:hypothetical protein
MYYPKKFSACKKAELSGNYEEAYYKLLDLFEKTMDSFGEPMRGNTIAVSGAGPHFKMIFNIPAECLNLHNSEVYPVAAMYNLWRTGFPSVPENYIERKRSYLHSGVPGDTSYFCLWIDSKNAYCGEMMPIDEEEYRSIRKHERTVAFEGPRYDDIKVNYKIVERAWKYPVVYLECEKHYYKYSWQF